MASSFSFEIHTPYRLFYKGEAQSVTLQLWDGEICVYANHSAFTAPVLTCMLRFKDSEGELRTAFISEGLFQVKEFKYVLIVNSAEWPDEINKDLALASRQQSQEIIKVSKDKSEIEKAKDKLRRAEYRLKVLEGMGK